MEFREVALRRNLDCPICGEEPTLKELVDYDLFCGVEPEGRGEGRDPLPQSTPREVAALLEAGSEGSGERTPPPFLLDVREPHEWEIGNLGHRGAVLIPYGEVSGRKEEIPKDRLVVVYCHVGVRSALVAEQLRTQGFGQVANLRGGYRAWVDEVEPALTRY
jgi:adenylyltransferase/sulfurtransferase